MSDPERYLVVISADAMVEADLDHAFTLPHIRRLKENGARIGRMESIYPSVTYPAHVTMSTGCWPEKTGVYSNEHLIPGDLHPAWYWFHDCVKCPDIFDAAKAAGLTTAAVFWPVTGNHPSIDHLIAEYWPQTPEDDKYEALRRAGSSEQVVRDILLPNLRDVTIRKHPETDVFIAKAAADMIRLYKPNLLMIHPADIDAYRHSTGVFSDKVTEAVENTDRWLGMLMDAAEDAGIYDKTDFVLFSDHGQMNISRVMCLNVKLAEAGLIRTNEDGSFADWDAYVKSCGMSCHVYVRDKKDEPRVYDLLSGLLREEVYGISEILTREEALRRFHLDGDFSFVLETDGFTSFGDDWRRPLMRTWDTTDYRHGRATHGYMPAKGPQPVFVCAGPHVRKGGYLENGLLIDCAPTMAAMLGISLPDAQGSVWTELLK